MCRATGTRIVRNCSIQHLNPSTPRCLGQSPRPGRDRMNFGQFRRVANSEVARFAGAGRGAMAAATSLAISDFALFLSRRTLSRTSWCAATSSLSSIPRCAATAALSQRRRGRRGCQCARDPVRVPVTLSLSAPRRASITSTCLRPKRACWTRRTRVNSCVRSEATKSRRTEKTYARRHSRQKRSRKRSPASHPAVLHLPGDPFLTKVS